MRGQPSADPRSRARVPIALLAFMLFAAFLVPGEAVEADDVLASGGQSAGAPQDPSNECGCPDAPPTSGEPVLVDTGEFAIFPGDDLTTPDLVIPVRGHTIDLRRTYRSGYAYHGPLGNGWDFGANRRLRQLDTGNLLVTSGTCRADEYPFTGSGWIAPPGVFRTLVQNPDGSYTETFPTGMKHTFDEHGNLIERRDRHGNRIAYEYSEDLMPILGRSKFFVDQTPRVVSMEYRLERILDR